MTAYDTNRLLDTLSDRLGTKNDAALSRVLGFAPPVISRLRHGRIPGPVFLLRAHEATDISIRDLRALMGDTGKYTLPKSEVSA